MKSRALLLLIFIISGLNLFATHYRGTEITYRWVANNMLQATVTTYTKFSYPSNLADEDSITFNWGDGTSSILPRINGSSDGSCAGASPCGNTIATDIRQSIYTGFHTYASSPSGSDFYTISFTSPSLVSGEANIDNGNSVNIPVSASAVVYMGSNYTSLPGGMDASPVFLNPPKYYAFVADTFTFNCAAVDPNGDSLSYSLIPPRQDSLNAVPLYVFPDAYCQANVQGQNSNSLKLDAQTGQLTWATPCTEGFFQIAIQVNEYRCGLFIGSVTRNMQITVIPDMIKSPVLSSINDVFLQPGQAFQLPITASDPSAYMDSLQVLGWPFVTTLQADHPTFVASTGNTATGTFSWTPNDSFASPHAYLFTVIATNNYTSAGPDGTDPYPASTTKSFRIWVQDTTAPCILSGINNISGSEMQVNIFPNPASSVLHIQSTQQFSGIIVSDLLGREIMTVQSAGTDYNLPVNCLPNGVYLLTIRLNNAIVTRRFVKIE